MATTVYLVRHANHSLLDRVLVGRGPAELSGHGRAQAQAVARAFARERIAGVQSSPQTRARQTAQPIAEAQGLAMEIVPAVDEIDLSAWTGCSFDDLKNDPQWHLWNSNRGEARAPGGESMREVQARMLQHLERVHRRYPAGRVVIVSHGDPIRAALLEYLDMPLNDFWKLRVEPASVSTILLHGDGGQVIGSSACIEDFVAA